MGTHRRILLHFHLRHMRVIGGLLGLLLPTHLIDLLMVIVGVHVERLVPVRGVIAGVLHPSVLEGGHHWRLATRPLLLLLLWLPAKRTCGVNLSIRKVHGSVPVIQSSGGRRGIVHGLHAPYRVGVVIQSNYGYDMSIAAT